MPTNKGNFYYITTGSHFVIACDDIVYYIFFLYFYNYHTRVPRYKGI